MGKTKEVENTTATTDTTTETETQEPVLPTNKEELDALMAGATEKGKLEAEEKYRGIQRTVSKKDQEIERLTKKLTQTPEDDLTLYEAMVADRKSRGEFEANDPVTIQMEQALATRKQATREQAQLRYQEKIVGENREKFNKLIEDAGLDPNDERLDDFHDAFADAEEDGRFSKAERKLDRILSKVKPKEKTEVKESEDDMKAKWIAEGERKAKEELGLLKTDNNQPSGTGAKKTYKLSELPNEEAKIAKLPESEKKAARKDLLDAFNEGRVRDE